MTHFLRNPNSDVAKWQAQVWEARVVIPPSAPPTPASSPPSPRLRPSSHSTKCHDERTKSRLALQTKYLISILPKYSLGYKLAGWGWNLTMAKTLTSVLMVRFSSFFPPRFQQDLTETLKHIWYGMVWWKWPKMLTFEPTVRLSSSFFPRYWQDLTKILRQVWFGLVWFGLVWYHEIVNNSTKLPNWS